MTVSIAIYPECILINSNVYIVIKANTVTAELLAII